MWDDDDADDYLNYELDDDYWDDDFDDDAEFYEEHEPDFWDE
jgi:hypothetical protein